MKTYKEFVSESYMNLIRQPVKGVIVEFDPIKNSELSFIDVKILSTNDSIWTGKIPIGIENRLMNVVKKVFASVNWNTLKDQSNISKLMDIRQRLKRYLKPDYFGTITV